jgi:tetratricopeptide (TPR) repeat protein
MDADDLVNLGQWELAAVKWESALQENPDNPHSLLWAALCWRKAKQEERAAPAEKKYHSLVLGDSAMMLSASAIYQYLGETKQAQEWSRLALYTSPRNPAWFALLYQNAETHLLQGQWQQALAGYEAYSLLSLEDSTGTTLANALRIRHKADIARGFSLLSTQPELGRSVLRKSHQALLADASLADQFFPALRLAGAQKEHDTWFEESWQQLLRIRDRFPQDDNVRNSAAWLASRALKRLDDAEKEVKEALRLRPNQAAYLDTLAEIYFARRNRPQAIDWSKKALIADPSATSLREQYFRFVQEPFPR